MVYRSKAVSLYLFSRKEMVKNWLNIKTKNLMKKSITENKSRSAKNPDL